MAGNAGQGYRWTSEQNDQLRGRRMTRTEVGDQARVLIATFVHDRMEADGVEMVPRQEDLFEPGTPTGEAVIGQRSCKEVATYLKRIGDELDGDENLKKLFDSLPPTAPQDTFMSVAKELFADNKFNWGRVVTLFYFAYKMAKKAIGQLPLIRTVIEWVVSFIVSYVSEWIIGRGGWPAIKEYFGSTTYQIGFVIAAAAAAIGVAYMRGH